jgi:hypothetical protein
MHTVAMPLMPDVDEGPGKRVRAWRRTILASLHSWLRGHTSTSSGGSGAASGSAIKIMALTPFNTPYDSRPYIYEAVEASAADVNRNGGVNGRPIDVVVCNDKNDPNG